MGRRSFRHFRMGGWLSLCLIFSLLFQPGPASDFGDPPVAAAASKVSDIRGHWAEGRIAGWLEKGWIAGYEDGSFRPNNPVTRAEFVALVNRSFGFGSAGHVLFGDVGASHWAYADIAAAVRAGYITGYEDGTFRPDRTISRQEAAVIVERLIHISAAGVEEAGFADRDDIAGWALKAVNFVYSLGIMDGYPEDHTFRPGQSLTRAEAVVILDRLYDARRMVYDAPGTYGPEAGTKVMPGNVVIDAPGVKLRNMEIYGDLTFGDGIGEGDAYLENVTVHGTTYIQGGGENSIHIANSVLVSITVDKQIGSVRVVLEGATTVTEVLIQTPAAIDAVDAASAIGSVKLSELLPKGSTVTLLGEFENVEVHGSEIIVVIPSGAVAHFTAGVGAEGLTLLLGEDATVVSLVLDAVAKILGDGKIEQLTISEKARHGSVIEAEVEEIVGGAEQPAPGGSQTPPSEPVTISLRDVVASGNFAPGETVSAAPVPAAATVRFQWQRSDEKDGTYEDIAGAVSRTYQVQEDDLGKWIRVRIVGTGNYTGTLTSVPQRVISAAADVSAQDFGVFIGSGVIGYSVGFKLVESTAADVENVKIELYKGTKKLADVVSGKVLENYPNHSVLSAPFNLIGNFDYASDEGGNWIYSGWLGEVSDIPDKAEISVVFKNGKVKTATNENLTGDVIVFQSKAFNVDLQAGYASIQDAIDAAMPGDNTIWVLPVDHGTNDIGIRQREGVNITLVGMGISGGKVVLKNPILIDGDGRGTGPESLTIRGFIFDFSDAAVPVDMIRATKGELGSTKNNYAHNITLEDVEFRGNGQANAVGIRTNTGATFGLTIRNCIGTGLHSLGQLHVAKGFVVENCVVTGSESGISFYGDGAVTITNLTVEGTDYGVRAGQGGSGHTPNVNSTLAITSSQLTGASPIDLRGDAPHEVTVQDTTLKVLKDENGNIVPDGIDNSAGTNVNTYGVTVILPDA